MERDWMDKGTLDSPGIYNGHGGTFKNTLAEMDTPDPSVIYQDGYYYMTFTHNGADVMVMKSRTLDFRQAQSKTVWNPPIDTAYSANLWAPEIQYIQGKWYIYFAADDGLNENHRMYVLEADTDDPMGDYTFKGQVKDETNKWAIDGLAMEHEGKLYFVWSGWEGDVNVQQNTYIAPMSDPLTISGPRVLLNEPTLDWEQAGGPPYIDEGQSILKKAGRLFIVYSGAGSWTPFYSLGMLALDPGTDPLVAANWKKSEQPLLQMDEQAGVFGPGHNSFVTSPDGTEDWIVYHATTSSSDGWNNRRARAQRVSWNEAGMPEFGKPLSLATAIAVPTGAGVIKSEYAKKAGERVEFDGIPATLAAEVPLLIHYRNTSGGSLPVDLLVNGDKMAAPVELAPTKVEQTGYVYTQAALQQSDNNVISLPAAIAGLETTAIEIPRYEAESAEFKGSTEMEENLFASGLGVVKLAPSGEAGGTGNAGKVKSTSTVQFTNIAVPEKRDYTLRIAASNAGKQTARLKVVIDGEKTMTVEVAKTKRNQFVPVDVTVSLKAGVHMIHMETVSDQVSMDYIDIIG
ncbi:carbohydrate-binding protein [Paenibacillus albus]|uniref:Carbohydrate-binding protein n=2 Tax=Paenibacillus albus TaxID=2495582 RepID=A0A3Q8XBS5_9BACL|nr:carbohydrate-binding protein [Paenibacillus albus]